ncbi:unnamed protein product [Mytilus coruscus]|uniref:Uncharacterized protein n=1 Tax=Mytilus coruscus TaxID=42192 RepID=A0A6J8BXM8_MYTCO|nr:unnamed protein product [Mytilus coruscus]
MHVCKGNTSWHDILLHSISECLPDTVDIRLHSAFGKTVHWFIHDADQDTDSTAQDLYTSTKLSYTTVNSACECPCSQLGKQNTTEFPIEGQSMHIKKRLEELENAIRINPKTTSKYSATIISAADDSLSSRVIGCIGAFVICLLNAFKAYSCIHGLTIKHLERYIHLVFY